MPLRRPAARAVAGLLTLGAVSAAGLVAASSAAAAARPSPLVNDRAGAADASSVAGYGASLAGFPSPKNWSATATFTVPTVTCTPATTSPLFVQLFFNGTATDGSGLGAGGYVIAFCDGETASYSTNVSVAGGEFGGVGGSASAGDVVTVSFKASRSVTTGTLTDVTSGQVTNQSGTGFAAVGGMQVSVQAGDAHSPFPAFKKVTFSKVLGGGQKLATLNPFAFQATGSNGKVKVATSDVASSGSGFTCTYKGNFGTT